MSSCVVTTGRACEIRERGLLDSSELQRTTHRFIHQQGGRDEQESWVGEILEPIERTGVSLHHDARVVVEDLHSDQQAAETEGHLCCEGHASEEEPYDDSCAPPIQGDSLGEEDAG